MSRRTDGTTEDLREVGATSRASGGGAEAAPDPAAPSGALREARPGGRREARREDARLEDARLEDARLGDGGPEDEGPGMPGGADTPEPDAPGRWQRAWALVAAWGACVATLLLFALLASELAWERLSVVDVPALRALARWRSPVTTEVALFLDLVGGSYTLLPITLLLAAWIAFGRRRGASGRFLVFAVGGAVALNLSVKLVFERARPEFFASLTPEPAPGYSFPSGHAMTSASFALALALLARRLEWRGRFLLTVALALFALGVGASRSYLQVHYPSDVMAGWALATAWTLAAYRIHVLLQDRARRERGTLETGGREAEGGAAGG